MRTGASPSQPDLGGDFSGRAGEVHVAGQGMSISEETQAGPGTQKGEICELSGFVGDPAGR
jgi:hypothetical protein